MGIFKSIFGICNSPKLNETLWHYENNVITIEESVFNDQNAAGVYMKGQGLLKPVLLYRGDDDALHAVQSVCPHAKRKIDPIPGSGKLRCCSLMHSTFDYNGKKLSGPAHGDLTIYPISQQNGQIQIAIG